MEKFHHGDRVSIKPGTFHNPRRGVGPQDEPLLAVFERYMAGDEYAIVVVDFGEGLTDIRVKVEDLSRE